MLRTIFVLALVALGIRHALRGPFYAVLFYLWIAYFRPETWVWEGIVQDLNLSLLVGVYTLGVALLSGQAFKLNGRLVLLVLFMLDGLVSTLASPYSAYAWGYWRDFLKSTLITYLLVVLTDDIPKLRLVFWTIALSLGFEAAKQGWGQLLFIPGEKNFNEVIFLGDNNGVAVGMFMLVPVIVALFQTAKAKWAKRGWIFLAVGVIYRGISTYSRGGLITCAAILGLSVVRAKKKMLAFGAVALLALVLAPILSDKFYERMGTITLNVRANGPINRMGGDEASTLGRLHFWQIALVMLRDRPMLGVGHNAYVAAYNDYDDSNGAFGRRRSVHSSWLGILSELGIPGTVLFLTILILGLRTCARIRKLSKRDAGIAELLPYANAVQMALFAFVIGGTFVIFQYTEMLWHFLGLTMVLDQLAVKYAQAPVEARVPGTSTTAAMTVPSGRFA